MNRISCIASAAALSALGGCATRFPPPVSTMRPCTVAAQPSGLMYFASTRAVDCLTPDAAPTMTASRADGVHYGTIAPDGGASLSSEADWTAALTASARAARRVVVYIHGYNNSFAASAERAAMVQAAAGPGVPTVLFAWPSQNATLRYMWDENDAAWTQPDADTLLVRMAGMADRVTLVAHSMGTRLAVAALVRLQQSDPAAAAKIDRLVLAAPDFDRAALARYAARELLDNGRKVTLYVSRLDRALQTSFRLHGYARAGDPSCDFDLRRRPGSPPVGDLCYWPPTSTGPWPDVVDLSNVSRKQLSLGHADFVDSQGGYADLCHVLKGEPATNRTGHEMARGIWRLPETATVGKPHC